MVGPLNYTPEQGNENRSPPFPQIIQNPPYPTLIHDSLAVPRTFHHVSFHCAFSFLYFPLLFCSFLFMLISISAFLLSLCISLFLFFVPFFLFPFLPPCPFLSLCLPIFLPPFHLSSSPPQCLWSISIRNNCAGLWIFYIKQLFWELKCVTQVFIIFTGSGDRNWGEE